MAEYTLCLVPYGPDRISTFTEHEEVLTLCPRPQDCLVKFEIPSALGPEILESLAEKGIDDGTLLSPVALDQKMNDLIDDVFGPTGRSFAMRIR